MPCLKHAVPIGLEHQEKITSFWKPLCEGQNLQFAEYSFANAYLFRRQHNYTFIDCDPPLIRGEFSSGRSYYIPTCVPKECLLEKLRKPTEDPTTLFPIPEQWLNDFQSLHPQVQTCRQDSDYLYHAEKLRTLAGRALSSRRNLLHQFEAQHQIESKPFTTREIPDALKVLEAWQGQSPTALDKTDYLPCRDAFDNLERLGLFGRIVYADGLPVGFALGELLTPKTALLHLTKTIHSYKGVTPFLYQDFAKNLPASVEWINLEQDLGIPALRHAKEAYEPDVLLPKHRVTIDF